MSRRPSDIDPFAGPAPVPFARPVTADKAKAEAAAKAEQAPPPAPPAAPSAPAGPVPTLSGASNAVKEAGREAAEMRKVDKDLEFLIRARYPVLYMLTSE